MTNYFCSYFVSFLYLYLSPKSLHQRPHVLTRAASPLLTQIFDPVSFGDTPEFITMTLQDEEPPTQVYRQHKKTNY